MDQNAKQKFKVRCRGIILHQDKLLVVSHRADKSIYALPGGHLENLENPLECIEREMVEELGIKPNVGRLLYVHNFISPDSHDIEFFFEILNSNNYINLEKLSGTHKHELVDIRWISKDNKINLLPEKIARDFKNEALLSDQVRFI